MKKITFFIIRIVLFVNLSFSVSGATIKLPSIICSNMVLQQNNSVPLWGEGNPNEKFSIFTSWNEEKYHVTIGSDGNWQVNVQTSNAGGPYQIEIRTDSSAIVLENVLLGEVWLCSGQSNMEMPLKGYGGQPVYEANEEILNARFKGIRLFHLEKNTSLEPISNCNGQWEECSPLLVSEFSAVAWFFGKYIHQNLKVPVGLISSNWGGTTSQAWTSKEKLIQFAGEALDNQYKNRKKKQDIPSSLFNAMINPITPFHIKGVIWYQGESNRSEPELYAKIFPALIEDWRENWGYNFPFYFTQIAPYSYKAPDETGTALIREAQLNTMLNVPNTGMVVTLDIGEKNSIHPPKKKEVGKRLALWALAKNYGIEGIGYTAPVYKSMKVTEDGVVELSFDHLGKSGISMINQNLKYLEIAGEDKVFHTAKAKILNQGKSVKVWSDNVKNPVAVRYCFKNWCEGTLMGTNGLPVSSFRTDDWD